MADRTHPSIVKYLPDPNAATLPPRPDDDGRPAGAGDFAPPGYDVLGELGRGGMGVVYKARQRSLNRVVALKVILGAGHAGTDQLARFRAEATAVARLQHPNIVQVYETGEHLGQPYFSQEYVDGGSLADRLKGEPQPPVAAADLVRTLAIAVHHAHERGVVHRDLKPANVLIQKPEEASTVADKPLAALTLCPKVTDFGLAKLQASDSHLTASGAVVGTPSYMAPEQAAGRGNEVGPAADVYALGAVLYECLTGRPPFRGPTVMDTVLQVMNDEPVPPSRLQPKVPRDLETICLKCLAKVPGQRYASAAALADDLGHFIDDEPILARPASPARKAWKWARRHPALAAIAFILAVPLPALLAVMVYLWADARDARVAAEADRAAAIAAKDAAERDRALTQGYLRSTVAGVDRILDRVGDERLARIPGFHADRAAILDDATAMFESLLRIDSGEPTVRYETAQTYLRVARLGAMGGRHAEAIAAAQSAIDLLTALSAEQPDRPDYRHDLARAYAGMGTARLVEADFAAAQVAYEKTVGLCSALTEQFPDAMEYRVTGAEARRFLGLFLVRTDPARAHDHFSAALEVAEDYYRLHPEAADARAQLAVTLGHFGQFLAVRAKPVEAERMLLRGWDLVDPVRHPDPPPPSARTRHAQALDALRNGLGQLYLNSGRFDRAETMLRAAAAESESLIAGNPKSFPYRLQAMNAYSDLSAVFNAQNNQPEAARTFSRALALLDDLVRDFPRASWLPMQRRGLAFKHAFALARAGRRSEAETAARNFTRTNNRIAGGNAFNLACLFALLVKNAPAAEADALANEAIGWLKRAEATGYPENAEQVAAAKTDDDLASLRGRPAFDLWLKELKPIPPKMKP